MSKDNNKDHNKKQFKHVDNQLKELEEKVDNLTASLQRERADAINQKRRHDEETARMKGHLKASVVRDLLPVIDNFERSLKHVPSDLDGHEFIKGIQGIVKQFDKTLADLGVEKIKTVGERFNPTFHEAVSFEEGDGTEEIVSEEMQSGYRLGDDVIRHAYVKVEMQ